MLKNRLKSSCLVILGLFIIAQPVMSAEKLVNKTELQEKSQQLLKDVDGLMFNSPAIYVDQTANNVCNYNIHYLRAEYLLFYIDENLHHWEGHVKRNRNDKVFQVFKASMQLALYAIYSRHEEFLLPFSLYEADEVSAQLTNGACMKRIKKKYKSWAETKISKIPEMGGYDEITAEWQDKAQSAMGRAKESLDRALQIDPDYKDGLIVKAQLLAMDEQWQQARDAFAEIDEMGYFNESRSYYHSWLAFIKMAEDQVLTANPGPELDEESLDQTEKNGLSHRELLRTAAGYSEPYANKDWAAKTRAHLVKRTKLEIRFDFPPTTTIDGDFNLADLHQQSVYLTNGLRYELLKYVLDQKKGLRKPLPPEVKKDLAKYAANHEYVLMDILDTSDANMERYDQLVLNIYKLGIMLERVMDLWEQLSMDNEQSRFYYQLNKSSCGLALLEAVTTTDDIVGDVHFQEWQGKAHKRREEKRKSQVARQGEVWFERPAIDYKGKWDEWQDDLQNKLPRDIELVKGAMLAGALLDFEYQALTAQPDMALSLLDELEAQLHKYDLQVLPPNSHKSNVESWQLCDDCQSWDESDNWGLFNAGDNWQETDSRQAVDGKNYLAVWRSYLTAKAGEDKKAENYLSKAERLRGMDSWKQYQEKVLYFRKALAVK